MRMNLITKKRLRIAWAMAAAVVLAGIHQSTSAGSSVRRVNTSAAGAEAANTACGFPSCNNGRTSFHAVSATGRFSVFASLSDNLVPNDTNGVTDIFVKDALTGGIVRANTDAAGNQANAATPP